MIAIDANIFLELLLQQEKYEECKTFLEKVRDGKIQALISDFTISGIVIVLERYQKNWQDIRTFLLSILKYKGLRLYQPTIHDKINSTHLMRDYKLDFEDAIVLQCALTNNCTEIISYDTDFNNIKNMKRKTPAS